MAKFNLKETSLLEKMCEFLKVEKKFECNETGCAISIEGLIKGLAQVLSFKKDKEKPVAVVMENILSPSSDSDNIILAIIAKYDQDPEDEEKGNWQITMGFSGEDIPEGAEILSLMKDNIVSISVANEIGKLHILFSDETSMKLVLNAFPLTLKSWLDVNAKEGETTTIETDEFEASVAIEDGVKYFSITPGIEIKKMIAKTEED